MLLGQAWFRRVSLLLRSAVASQWFSAALASMVSQSFSTAADRRGFAGFQCCLDCHSFRKTSLLLWSNGASQGLSAARTAMVCRVSTLSGSRGSTVLRCGFLQWLPHRCHIHLLFTKFGIRRAEHHRLTSSSWTFAVQNVCLAGGAISENTCT